jgi:hypothetical protein
VMQTNPARRTKLSRTKMAIGTIRNARGVKKGPKIAAFAGSISDRAKLSEFIRIPGPPHNGPQTNPSNAL